MSVRLMADVFEFSEARGSDRLVLLAISDEADDDGKGGYPGFDLLAKKCRLPKTTVRRAVDRLEELGELRVERPAVKGRGHYTTYEVTIAQKRANLAPSGKGPERAGKGHNGPERAAAVPLTCDDSDTQYPVPRTQVTPIRDSPEFARFWAAYPRKDDKGDARKAWPKAVQRAGGPDRIIAGAERLRDDPNREDKFTKMPAVWLRAESWDNSPIPAATNGRRQAPMTAVERSFRNILGDCSPEERDEVMRRFAE